MVDDRDSPVPDVLDEIAASVFVHDPVTGRIVGVNAAAERLYGRSAADLRGKTIEDVTADVPDHSARRADRLVSEAASGAPRSFEWPVTRSNGELRWLQVRLRRITVDGEAYVLAEQRDITKYKEKDRRLRLLYRVLRHNLRNEMNLVRGYAEQLLEAADDHEEELRVVRETAERVASISSSVSDLERVVDRDPTDPEPTPASAVVREAVDDLLVEHPRAVVDVDCETTARIDVDDGIRLALRNVFENAVEHSDRERPRIDVSVRRTDDRRVRLRIADDGPGIPSIELEALRDEGGITDVSHGSGLGLWTAKWAVEAHGGDLDFSANEPRGTVVEITLPSVEAPDDADG